MKKIKMTLSVSPEIHEKLTAIKDNLKDKGLSMTLPAIVERYLELTKDKIHTGYE